MACPFPHNFDEIQALVTKFIDEDIIRQKALMELAVQFENASAAKSDFRKTYEKCYDITHESRALIDTFLKQESNKYYDMNLALYRKAAKIENQIESKYVWLSQNTNSFLFPPIIRHFFSHIQTQFQNLTMSDKKITQPLALEKPTEPFPQPKQFPHSEPIGVVLRQTLEEEARAEKEWEEKMKQEKVEYELFTLEFGVQSDSEYETD
ncbi:hypothetical protein Tco_1410259 [Tanacetum coccineum]